MRDPAGGDAEEPDRRLLVRVQEARSIREIVEGRIACYQSAVITPVESNPGEFQIGLILEVSCLIEGLIVVNAENFVPRDTSAKAGNLWREVAGPDVRQDRKGRKTVVSWDCLPNRRGGGF